MTEPYQGDMQKETSLLDGLDLISSEFIQNPYPIYTKLRQHSPVTAVKNGGYLLVRHADIVTTLKNPGFGNAPSRFSTLHAKNREKYTAADLAANILPFMDPPEHDLPRRIVTLAYRNRMTQFIEELVQTADIFASRVNSKEPCDVVTQIASPFTYVTMCRFLGIPDSDGEYLKQLSEFFFYLFAPINDPDKFNEINSRLVEFREYFRACLQDRKSQPKDDLVSYLYQTDYQGEKLTEDQVIDTCILLFADGVENVHYGVGNVLIELGTHPE
ncbi:MAG: cytochrome P450, partial [Gammaproteobacteria bacterium]|nr:cytochrome P450 [Gammaproteobacteria bacterium]